ncbi:hypothetical protein [Nocardiopsis algeriensis]|uniref:Uncharacterized protein n=1 Tax=Nocardiopsis algeriensis TaxID=1478215 RepID=A0A841IZG3_9ACTN|nr:hypothetical protein [Nocardiopsis algeriensis]MBB6121648.1 hypothetical protein [Nocardiopsis algeriensis]
MKRSRLALTLAALCTVTACGGPGGSTADLPSSAPSEQSSPNLAEASPAAGAEAPHPLEGTWRGPEDENGARPTLSIYPHGVVSLETGPYYCTGDASPFGNGSYVLAFTQCVVSLPDLNATLSEDGQTLTVKDGDDVEEWELQEGP